MTPPQNSHAPGCSLIGRPLRFTWVGLWALVWMVSISLSPDSLGQAGQTPGVETALERVRQHSFHPIREGFTFDRNLNTHGVASLDDLDWKVRLLALRDLVRAGTAGMDGMVKGLDDGNPHVRQVSAMALGILSVTNSIPALHRLLIQDPDEVVRSQAAVSLGQIAHTSSLQALRVAQTNDPSRDVQHQAELAAYAVQHGMGATPALAKALAGMEEGGFSRATVGRLAPDFELPDTDGLLWRLSHFRGKQAVVLVWIFADWCPVCHGEFRELIELRDAFKAAGVQVFTLECHDTFPARVMVGKEIEPRYWFSKTSFRENYTKNIWWPHLVDRAGAVGAEFGVQPLSFVVHAEWINRPSTVIVDREGIVRFAYYGTFWGDRPSIKQTLDMVRSGDFRFAAPRRLRGDATP